MNAPLCFVLMPFGKKLREAREGLRDSPIFELLDGLPEPSIEHLRTEVFREQVKYSVEMKEKACRSTENQR